MKRRHFLQGTLGGVSLSFAGAPAAWAQQAPPTRLLLVLLRGGMDGLCAVPPVDDSDYARVRASTAVHQALPLAQGFGLHPVLSSLHGLWQAGQLAVVHNTGFRYTGRSHFEGQDIMQSGVLKPYASGTGWVGRAMEAAQSSAGVSISIPMPLILRGNPHATTRFPNWMPALSPNITQQLQQLWKNDAALAPYAQPIQLANEEQRQAGRADFKEARTLQALARLAGQEMAAEDGPQVGLLDSRHGFDTHANQGGNAGGHADRLKELDQAIAQYQQAMGARWQHTLVLTVTEFGRTVAENGTTGTDHGVGSCCFLAGGLLTGSRVYADWRGLKNQDLFEARDLPITIDAAAIYALALERVFGLSAKRIQQDVLEHTPNPQLKGLLGI
jgi:uncharacterized protein (DUF1501 family)